MRSWKVLDVKRFMNLMLRGEAFDAFLLSEADITTGVSYVIDGHLTKDFYNEEELAAMGLAGQRCMFYGQVRPICFDMIKGRRTPAAFKFVFLANRRQTEEMLAGAGPHVTAADIGNLSLNIRYQGGELYVTCGCTMRTFTMDKTPERLWEQWVLDFLKGQQIPLEEAA